ncbi:MAG: hypothetical protein IIY21_04315 [Clostridiales bacterium]|nr:hypothetical protein [Clostridiales bacterium]MBQ1573890.1 hypothetical protein [Clostridiales bacterium]
MDINIKQYTTVIIGLVVAVVLVAGMMVPVISSLGNSGGGSDTSYTNESNTGDYYLRVTEDTNLTLYRTANEFSYEDPVINPDTEKWGLNDTYQFIIGEYFYGQNSSSKIFDFTDESFTITWPIVINGNTATFTKADNSTVTYEGVQFITAPQSIGDYVAITNDDDTPATAPYVGDSFVGVVVDDWSSDPEWVILGFGLADDGFSYTNYLNWSTSSEVYTDGQFILEGGYLDGISIPNGSAVNTYSVAGPEDDYEIYYFVPTEVTESGSGGTSISPTMMALISVIPLITVIGIVLGAITILRRN